MDMLAYWRWDNYVRDLDEGAGFNFNSNQSRLHSAINPGEHLWLVTGRPQPGGIRYLLVAKLQIAANTYNSPDYRYGRFRVWADVRHSAYYSADAPDVSDVLLCMNFWPRKPIASKYVIGQSLQTIRSLDMDDVAKLIHWTDYLKLEKRAYQVVDERTLEASYEAGRDALRNTIADKHTGVSAKRQDSLLHSYYRNRQLVRELHTSYAGRCQLCVFDPVTLYQVAACCCHHIVYLSRGGADEITNLVLLCPNHHEVIHSANAVFDFHDLRYVFPNGRREPLVLNQHLLAVGRD